MNENQNRNAKMSKKKRPHFWDDEIPIHDKYLDTTVCVSLAKYAKHPAVVKMVSMAHEWWDRITFFGNDFVHAKVLYSIHNNIPVDDLENKKVWENYFIFLKNCSKVKPLKRSDPTSVDESIFHDLFGHFDWVNMEIPAFHTAFFEYMGTAESTNTQVYNQYDTVVKHVATYLRGKYQLRCKSWATTLAHKVLADDEITMSYIGDGFLEEKSENWIRSTVAIERQFRRNFKSQSIYHYRHFMLRELERMESLLSGVSENDKIGIKKFTLIPTHSCGSSRFAIICGTVLHLLIPQVKEDFPEFYDKCQVDEENTKRSTYKLGYYFDFPEKNGWQVGRQVRSNGVELHVLFEKNKVYNSIGKPRPNKKLMIQHTDYWNSPPIPQDPSKVTPTNVVAVDKGYHNLFVGARFTGKYDKHGQRVFEVRKVKKTWYDHHSGRKTKTRKQKILTSRAQRKGFLNLITQHSMKTVNMHKFAQAIEARKVSYDNLYKIYDNRRSRVLNFAVRRSTQRTIDQIVNYISKKGKYTVVFGDCSKTTGFKSSSPGGPVKKIERHFVKRGYNCCEENEAYSSKASVCCHSHANVKMKNGQNIANFKRGKYVDTPSKMPRQIHGILHCKNCGKTWDRDLVGSVNIYDIFMDRWLNGRRPYRFTEACYKNTSDRQMQLHSSSHTESSVSVLKVNVCGSKPRTLLDFFANSEFSKN